MRIDIAMEQQRAGAPAKDDSDSTDVQPTTVERDGGGHDQAPSTGQVIPTCV